MQPLLGTQILLKSADTFTVLHQIDTARFYRSNQVFKTMISGHHGITRPQVADGGTASDRECSYEYIE